MSKVRETIAATINQVRASRGAAGKSLAELHDAATLRELGLDSLDLAVVVVRLEKQLGRDPFRSGRPLAATFGEFVALYESEAAAT